MFIGHLTLVLIGMTSAVTSSIVWSHQDVSEQSSPPMTQVQSREAHVPTTADFGYNAQNQHLQQNVQYQQPPVQQEQHSSTSDHSAAGSEYFGSGSSGSHVGQPSAYHYAIYPHYPYSGNYQNTYSTTPTEESGGWLCRTFGGICDDGNNRQGYDESGLGLGIAGAVAAGLKGLKLLKFLPFLPILIPFLPLFLPLLLILAIPVLIAAWFLPVVPVLVTARRLSVLGARNVQETLLSENCLERISCQISRLSRAYEYEAPWVQKYLDKASHTSKWIDRITRSGRSAGTTGCNLYTCHPVAALEKSLKIDR